MYQDMFSETKITIVVGYQAINIMNKYPQFHYIYNSDWHITKDSYSLGLALDNNPCYIIHSDFFISKDSIKIFKNQKQDCVVTLNQSDRSSDALNCKVSNDKITEIYKGKLSHPTDPEILGLYKITQQEVLLEWKKQCLENRNLLIGQNLPLNKIKSLYQISGDQFAI